MGFFSWKQTCGICGKNCGMNRWRVKKDKSWLCPQCFKNVGGFKNIEMLSTKSISELKQIISQKQYSENMSISQDYIPEVQSKHFIPASDASSASAFSKSSCANALTFKVAGVTFKTGRKSRQVMLKNIYFNNTPPFDGDITITFERYSYEGKLAIGVYANELQIGNVPSSMVSIFDNYWVSDYVVDYRIYGGGSKNWGCEIDVTFLSL